MMVLASPFSSSFLHVVDTCVGKAELDGNIAAECVLCGDIMVQSVNKPLVTREELAEQAHLCTASLLQYVVAASHSCL